MKTKSSGTICISVFLLAAGSIVLSAQQRPQPPAPRQAVRRGLPVAQTGGTVANPASFRWILASPFVQELQHNVQAGRGGAAAPGSLSAASKIKDPAAAKLAATAIRQGTFGDGGSFQVGSERTQSANTAGSAATALNSGAQSSTSTGRARPPASPQPAGSRFAQAMNPAALSNICPPGGTGIKAVDHQQPLYFIFYPGVDFNPYQIEGCGFGDQPGQVWLTGVHNAHPGPMTAGSLSQKTGYLPHPDWIKLNVFQNHWNNRKIDVFLDPNTSGYVHTNNVTLLVITSDGRQFTASGVEFSPILVEEKLASIPQELLVSLMGATSLTTITKYSGAALLAQVHDSAGYPVTSYIFSPSNGSLVLPGHTLAVVREDNIAPFPGGTDAYDFTGKLWITRVELFQAPLSPQACQSLLPSQAKFSTNGNWQFMWTGSPVKFNISWQEQSCTAGASTGSASVYALDMYVLTARGVDPWTTWQNQN